MCLAIPSRIVSIADNEIATVDVDGVRRQVSVMLIEEPRVGDYVIVHAGFAIHRIDESVAMESLQILKEAAAAADEQEEMERRRLEEGGEP